MSHNLKYPSFEHSQLLLYRLFSSPSMT